MDLLRVAYILAWFPKPSETFIFREVVNLQKMGLRLKVFTLYGPLTRDLSPEMRLVARDVERLGIPYLKSAWHDFVYWWGRNREETRKLMKAVLPRNYHHLEREGESLWGALCGVHLARRFQEEKITHIHAPWACGPATAAWVASRLTGIPYSFTGRAHDIFTPDSLLPQKIRDAAFVRCNSLAAIKRLREISGAGSGKFRLIYNGVSLTAQGQAPVRMQPPYRFLAVGRLVETKGFDFLLQACRLLKDAGIDFHLTVAGSGPKRLHLKYLTRKLGLGPQVSFPGFIPHDQVAGQFIGADILIMPCTVHTSGNRDGLPNVIIEALLHRVPVIASDVGAIRELVEDQETGFLIPQRDPQAIAEAVQRMIGDRGAAVEMAERGRSRVLADFNPDLNHRRVLELFQETCR